MNPELELAKLREEIAILKLGISKLKSIKCSCAYGVICEDHKITPDNAFTYQGKSTMEKRKQDILKYKPNARFVKVIDSKEMNEMPFMKRDAEKRRMIYEKEMRKREEETKKREEIEKKLLKNNKNKPNTKLNTNTRLTMKDTIKQNMKYH